MDEEKTSNLTPPAEISTPTISLPSGEEGKKVESDEEENDTIFEGDAANPPPNFQQECGGA